MVDFETLYNDFVNALKNEVPENSFTLRQLSDDTGLSVDKLRGVLDKLVERGVLDRELRVVKGHRAYVYMFRENDEFAGWEELLKTLV